MEHIGTYSYEKRKLRVFKYGKGENLLLIHGFLQNIELWYDFLVELSKHFHVIAPELPGHGKSEFWPDKVLSFDLLSGLYHNIINEYQLQNVILCGHSFGGYLALHMYEKNSEKFHELILINSSIFEDDEKKKTERDLQIKIINKGKHKLLFQVLIQSMFSLHSINEKKSEINDLIKASGNMAPETAIKYITLMKNRKDYSYLLVQEHEKLILINGHEDIYPRMYKPHIQEHPNVYTLKNTCHMGHIENPDTLLRIIKSFFL